MKNNTAKANKLRKQVAKTLRDESLEALKSVKQQVSPGRENPSQVQTSSNIVDQIIGDVPDSGFDQKAHAQETAAKLMQLRKRLKQIQEEELVKASSLRQQQEESWKKATEEKMRAGEEASAQQELVVPVGRPRGPFIRKGAAVARQKATKVETGRKKA